MVYEIISPRPHGSETFVGLHTEYPECIDPLSVQEAMLSGGSGQVFVSHVLSFSFVWIVFAQILQCSICCTTPIVSGSHIPASKQGLQNSNYKPSAFGWAAFFF